MALNFLKISLHLAVYDGVVIVWYLDLSIYQVFSTLSNVAIV